MALHVVLMMYDDAMIGSITSCSVVKMRAEEPQKVKSHVIRESYCAAAPPLPPVPCVPA